MEWGRNLCNIFYKIEFYRILTGWWVLESQIIYSSATHLQQLLQPDAFPWFYPPSGVMCSPWPMGHNIQRVAVCIWYYLDTNGVIQLLLEEWEWIWRGCFDPYMRATYSTNDIWRYSKNSALDLYDYINHFQYSQKHTAQRGLKSLTCILSLSEIMILWPKLWVHWVRGAVKAQDLCFSFTEAPGYCTNP